MGMIQACNSGVIGNDRIGVLPIVIFLINTIDAILQAWIPARYRHFFGASTALNAREGLPTNQEDCQHAVIYLLVALVQLTDP